MRPNKNKDEIRVTFLELGVATSTGAVYSFRNVQKVFNATLMRKISNKALYGEVSPPSADLGVVRRTAVDGEQVCLRVIGVGLSSGFMFGKVVPAGPFKDQFLEIVSEYKQPIPLLIRAVTSPNIGVDGETIIEEIITFDFDASLLQHHPKLPESGAVAEQVGFVATPSGSNSEPVKVAATEDTAGVVAETLGMIQKQTAGRKKRSKAAGGKFKTFESLTLNTPDLQAGFDIYFNGVQDESLAAVVDNKVITFVDDTEESILFCRPEINLLYRINRLVPTGDFYATTRPLDDAKAGPQSLDVEEAFQLLAAYLEECAEHYNNPPKESDDMSTTEKKPSAKEVFKGIKPIVSKNVAVDLDKAVRVTPKSKFDGYLKKLDGKLGAFVRVGDNPDIFVVPYSITAAKTSAGERSLRDALKTRGITQLEVTDLK